MRQCTECDDGTVQPDGYCDYCGMRAVASPDHANGSAGPLLPGPPQPPPVPARPGSSRPTPFSPLELTGVPAVPYRDPERTELLPEEPADGLKPGELVGGQYEVRGCLDRGGQGWIYLAHDNNVGHWVVLKGLIDGSADMSAVLGAERAALAAVNHPNIVRIHDFVRHPAPEPGRSRSYIVMEYVGGQSLKRLLDARQAALPVDHVIAYGIEMLSALGYLHGHGLLYCDLKPANIMQWERRLTLIDLGGAWRIGDPATNDQVWGTPGYSAPEVRSEGPSIRSDLYTVGRTMAKLSFPAELTGKARFTGEFEYDLPPRDDVPVLTEFESYDRLLRRATHPDPRHRFRDAEEMREQLYGVLREVVSAPRKSESWPVSSTLFGRERRAVGAEITADGTRPMLGSLTPRTAVAALPVPLVYGPDDAAGLADLAHREPEEIIETLTTSADPQVSSPEARLLLAGAHLDLGRRAEAAALLDELTADEGRRDDWRIEWYRGISALAAGDCATAREIFDRLYTRLPGEAAPKLALAFCCEYAGDRAEAARRYESVWRTDRGYLSAAFGLARVRLDPGDLDGAMRVLDEVPSLSRHHGAAQLAAMAVTIHGRPPEELCAEDLLAAAARLDESRVDGERRSRLDTELLEAGLAWVRAGGTAQPGAHLIGAPLTEKGLRHKLERTYRELARLAKDIDVKQALVAKANAVRSMTLF